MKILKIDKALKIEISKQVLNDGILDDRHAGLHPVSLHSNHQHS